MPLTVKRICTICGREYETSPYGGGGAYHSGGYRPCCPECIKKYKLKTYV